MLCLFSWVSSVIAGTMGLKFIFPRSSCVQFSTEGLGLTTECVLGRQQRQKLGGRVLCKCLTQP